MVPLSDCRKFSGVRYFESKLFIIWSILVYLLYLLFVWAYFIHITLYHLFPITFILSKTFLKEFGLLTYIFDLKQKVKGYY